MALELLYQEARPSQLGQNAQDDHIQDGSSDESSHQQKQV